MISKMSLLLSNYFARKGVYPLKKIRVYQYGFELLLSTIINLLGILFTAVFMGIILEAIFFCIGFISLRRMAGGYHAKHHWSCIIGFNVIFSVFAVFHQYLNERFTSTYLLFAMIMSTIFIWLLAPVEAVNKPLGDSHKNRQRKKSTALICFSLVATLSLCHFELHDDYRTIFAFYISGIFAASLSLVAAIVANGRENVAT